MRLQQKSISRLTLENLLRRKRTNLQGFLKETGIVTYERLVSLCDSIGVLSPTEAKFRELIGNSIMHEVSSPVDGIVVLNPQPEEEAVFSESLIPANEAETTVHEACPKKKKTKAKHDY